MSIRDSLISDQNQKLTPEEQRKFTKIYKNNFAEIPDNSKNPELIRGIDVPEKPSLGEYADCSVIDINMEFVNGGKVYTDGFKELIEKIDKIIYDDSKKDDIKYVLIGECLKDSHCSKYDLKYRLIKHILSYLDKILHNKAKLLSEMDLLNVECIKIIGNCDYENFEGISNKEIEQIFRSIDFTKLPAYVSIAVSSLIIKLPAKFAIDTFKKIHNFIKPRKQLEVKTNLTLFKPKTQDEKDEHEKKKITDHIKAYFSTPEFANAKDITNEARKISSIVRSEIITLHELQKEKFCSSIEVAKLYDKTKNSPYWLTVPRLTMFIMSSSSLITNFALSGTGNSSTTLTQLFSKNHSSINALVLSTFLTSILTPLAGTIIALGIGTLLESEFWKNLTDSRRINVQFMKLISDTESYHPMLNAEYKSGERCSFRNDSDGYIQKFKEVNDMIGEYKAKSMKYFDNHCDKLYFYLFVYNFVCKIKPEERNVPSKATDLNNPAPQSLDPTAATCKDFAIQLRDLFVNTKDRVSNANGYQLFKNKLDELKNFLGITDCPMRDITSYQHQLRSLIDSLNAVVNENNLYVAKDMFSSILCGKPRSPRGKINNGGKSTRKKTRRIFKRRKLTKKC